MNKTHHKRCFPWFVIFMVAMIAILTFLVSAADKHTEAQAAVVRKNAAIQFPPESMPEMTTEAESVTITETPVPDTTAENTEKETEPERTYTAEDLEILAHLLAGECQGGSWDLQVAVGSVVLNRVDSKHYPDSICGVVFDTRHGIQYMSEFDGNARRTPTKKNWAVADYLLKNGSQIPSDVTMQGQKKWKKPWRKIETEWFCYEED